MDFDIVSTQQIGHNNTEPSVTLQKTLYLLVNNEKKLLKLGENKIGRSADSDVCLTSDAVSYYHAVIECEPDEFTIQDLRSTNGTKRNGKTIKPYVLYELLPHTQLVFGDVEAVFHAIDDDQTEAISEKNACSLQIDEDIINEHTDESLSLLDPNVDVAQVADIIIAPAVDAKADGTPPPVASGSKWNELVLPPLDFTEEENPIDKSGTSTESEFEFFDQNAASNPSKDHSNLNCKTRMLNIDSPTYDLETQKPLSEKLMDPIYDVETQNDLEDPGKKENIYNIETQQSPPQGSPIKSNVYEQDTQIPPLLELKINQSIYEVETQQPNTPNSPDNSLTDIADSDVAKKTICNEIQESTTTKEGIKENNLNKKVKKKIKLKNEVYTSDEEEAQETRKVHVKPKRKKLKENNNDHMQTKQTTTDGKKSSETKTVNDVRIGDFNDVNVDNSTTADCNISVANDTNSESFIGMVVGKKKRFFVRSSSEDSNESDLEKKNVKSASPKADDRSNIKVPLNSTYDINVQNSIDELYLNELNTSNTQPEESQFINEVLCTPLENSKEEPESQFILDECEIEEEPSNQLPPESQSLLDHEPTDIDASSKNTTNYDTSEMELDSVLDGTRSKHSIFLKNNDKNMSNIGENSSSMFSVSETEIQPDFVPDDIAYVEQSGKASRNLPVNEDSSTTSDFEVFEVMRRTVEEKNRATLKEIQEELSEGANKGKKCTPQKSKKNKKFEKKTAEPQKCVESKKKISKQVVISDHNSCSSQSDINTSVTDKSKHDTIDANQTEESAAIALDDDFFDAETQEAKPSETDESFVAPSQENSLSDFFNAKPRNISTEPGDTDDSFVAPTQKELPENFFDVETQKVSKEPSETDKSLVASNMREVPEDFFDAATQKVSTEPSKTDDSFVAPTQKELPEDFFDAATQKVSIEPSETDDSFVVSTQKELPEDFFDAATQKVSIEPNETEPLVAATSKGKITKDIFEATTEKVNVRKQRKGKFPTLPIQENESSDEDFFNAATQKVEEVRKIKLSAKSAPLKKNNIKSVRQYDKNDSESSDFLKDNQKVTKKKINLRNEREEPIKNKKVTKIKKENSNKKDTKFEKEHRIKLDIPIQENESSDDDFFNAATQKVEDVQKGNTNISKSTPSKIKDIKTPKKSYVGNSESSDLSEENQKVTQKKANLKSKKVVSEIINKTEDTHELKESSIEEEKRKVLVSAVEPNVSGNKCAESVSVKCSGKGLATSESPIKREITRIRKKNPKYENSPTVEDRKKNPIYDSSPTIEDSENNSRKQKKINKKENKPSKEKKTDKNHTSSTESLLLHLEENTPISLQTIKGRKKTTNKDFIETNFDKQVDTTNSKSITTSSKLTPLKNEISVIKDCLEKEQPKKNHTGVIGSEQVEENTLQRSRGRKKGIKENAGEIVYIDELVDIKNIKSKRQLNVQHCEEKDQCIEKLLENNTPKPLRNLRGRQKIKNNSNEINNDEIDATNSIKKSTSSKMSPVKINEQSKEKHSKDLLKESITKPLLSSRDQTKIKKNDVNETNNIIKNRIEEKIESTYSKKQKSPKMTAVKNEKMVEHCKTNQQSIENNLGEHQENLSKSSQNLRVRKRTAKNDSDESNILKARNDEKIDTAHVKNEKIVLKNCDKTEQNSLGFPLEENVLKPLQSPRGRKKITRNDACESNAIIDQNDDKVHTTCSRNKNTQSKITPVKIDKTQSEENKTKFTGKSNELSEEKTSNPSRDIRERKKTKKVDSTKSNIKANVDEKLVGKSTKDKTLRTLVTLTPEKGDEDEFRTSLANSPDPVVVLDRLEDKTSSTRRSKLLPSLSEDKRKEEQSSKTTPENKKAEVVENSSHEAVQSRQTGKRAQNTREEEVPMRGSPVKKKAKNAEEVESNESLSAVNTKRSRGRPCKGTTPKKETTKRKGSEEGTMKAPVTPKKRRENKEIPEVVRSSPRQRSSRVCDSESLRSRSSSSESANSTTSSERRQKLSISTTKSPELKVTFTMIDNVQRYDKLLTSLRGSTTDDALLSDVLVTVKVARSLKFLMFLALGKPIVSLKWLTDSERSMRFMPHEPYILRDAEAEKRYGFKLAQSIVRAKETKLLENYSVFVTDSVKPAPGDMKSIVECAGGSFLSKLPTSWPPYSIIVTDPGDSKQLKKLQTIPGSKPSIVNKEFILSGILQQKLDFVKHKMK